MDSLASSKPTLGGYLVGIYLFSVPAFGFAESSSLLIIPQILGALLAGYALYDVLGRFEIQIPAEIGLYALLGLWAVLTHFVGPRAGEGLTPSLGTLLKVVVATVACSQLIRTDADLFMVLRMFAFSVVLVYVQNVEEIKYLQMAGGVADEDRFAGTLSNANAAAIFALTVVWAAILMLLRAQKAWLGRVTYFVPIGVSLVIIYYSGSKKGLIGLALLVLFVTWLMYKRQEPTLLRKGLAVLVSAGLIVVAGYFIYTSPFFFRMEQFFAGMSNASDSARWDLAREAIQVWLMDPKTVFMGVGYDNFWSYSTLGTYAHSTPLELLASNGIIGLALFLGFLTLLVLKFIRLYKGATEPGSKVLHFAILVFLFVFTFFMATAVLHDSKEMLPILGCLAGFGRYQLGLTKKGHEDPGIVGPRGQ
jgi:O-antigen ligase